jgi:hypothetical protein
MRTLLFTLGLAAVASGQFLHSPADPIDGATFDAMFHSSCGGKIVKGQCQANPIDGTEGAWSIKAARFGHFLSPKSDDAIVTTTGFQPVSWFPVGSLLMSKRAGKWVALGRKKEECRCENC